MKEFVEKLIEKFEKEAFAIQLNQGIKHPSTHDMFLETFTVRQIEEIVNQLAEEYNNGWIPCSERLPNMFDVVLAITEDDLFYVAVYNTIDKQWFDDNFEREIEVIAWMPLPAPYQKGSE